MIQIDQILRKLRKVNRRACDPSRGVYEYYIVLDNIFRTLSEIASDTTHQYHNKAEDVLISLLSHEWYEYIRYCAYCCLAHVTKNCATSPIVHKTLQSFRDDILNTDIITKAHRLNI